MGYTRGNFGIQDANIAYSLPPRLCFQQRVLQDIRGRVLVAHDQVDFNLVAEPRPHCPTSIPEGGGRGTPGDIQGSYVFCPNGEDNVSWN